MNKDRLANQISQYLFGKPQSLKSYHAMRNYLDQLDIYQLRRMLKGDK